MATVCGSDCSVWCVVSLCFEPAHEWLVRGQRQLIGRLADASQYVSDCDVLCCMEGEEGRALDDKTFVIACQTSGGSYAVTISCTEATQLCSPISQITAKYE